MPSIVKKHNCGAKIIFNMFDELADYEFIEKTVILMNDKIDSEMPLEVVDDIVLNYLINNDVENIIFNSYTTGIVFYKLKST